MLIKLYSNIVAINNIYLHHVSYIYVWLKWFRSRNIPHEKKMVFPESDDIYLIHNL